MTLFEKKSKSKKLTEKDLVSMIDSHIASSSSYSNKIHSERAQALKFFHSEPYGNERKGRSSYVSSEVMETITWALPQIIKVFETNDDLIKFDPISSETIEAAELATQYCEYVLKKQNNGFLVLYTFIFDLLLQKNGFVKVYYDNTKEYVREDYESLSELEVIDLLEQPGVTPIEKEEIEISETHDLLSETGQIIGQIENVARYYNLSIKRVKNNGKGKIKIENVPPEEVIVSKLAKSLNLDESPFVAHKVKKTISWLRSQGYVIDDDISDSDSSNTFEQEKLVRDYKDGTFNDEQSDSTIDPSQRLVTLVESYMQVDWNNDGISEWRKITKVGSKVLDNVECFTQPFISASPMPLPHKFNGVSMADMVMDLQYLKSLLMRAMLDSYAFNINPAKAVNVNKVVDINDLMETDPGTWIKIQGDTNNAIFSLPTSGIGDAGLPILGYIDNITESRSGISKYTQGIDSNVFNKTATGTQAIMNASQEKIALISRIIAETGLAEIYKKILKVASMFVKEDQLIQSGQNFVSLDPKQWMNLEILTVNVGTGSLDKAAEINQCKEIMSLQQQLLQSGIPTLTAMVDPNKLYNAGSSLLKAFGKKNIFDYFNAPSSEKYKQNLSETINNSANPKPDPLVEAARVQAEAQLNKIQMDGRIAQQKSDQTMQINAAEFDLEVQTKQKEFELQKLEIEMKYQLEMAKLQQANKLADIKQFDSTLKAYSQLSKEDLINNYDRTI